MTRRLPIPTFEGVYEIDEQGVIYSLRTGYARAGYPDRYGYFVVTLRKNGTGHVYRVHRLVMLAFAGEPEGRIVRHLDGDKNNNTLANLRYGTPSENMRDQIRHGTHGKKFRTHCPNGHEFSDENTTYITTRPDIRRCKTCHRERSNASYHRRRSEAA